MHTADDALSKCLSIDLEVSRHYSRIYALAGKRADNLTRADDSARHSRQPTSDTLPKTDHLGDPRSTGHGRHLGNNLLDSRVPPPPAESPEESRRESHRP